MEINLSRFIRAIKITHKGVKRSIIRAKHPYLNMERRYSSALYVSGKSGKGFSYLTPYLDFDQRFANMEEFEKDLKSRGINVDVKNIKESWDTYKFLNTKKCSLEERTIDLYTQLKKFHDRKDLTSDEEQELNKLLTQVNVVKNDLKLTKNLVWDLDDTLVQKLLKLPNKLYHRTPLQSSVVLNDFGSLNKLPEEKVKSHLEIGKRLGLLEYKNPMQCYLCNDAALFELGVLGLAGATFNADDMIRIAGSDFSRGLVVEGSGLNHENPMDSFILDNHSEVDKDSPNRMHLVGGASLTSFLSMHAKQLINPKHFPLRYFSAGRQYTPFPVGSAPIGLFTVCQSSAVHAFVVVKDINSEEHDNQFERLLKNVCKLYESVCDHYQVVMRSASELRPWEGMRVSFELWSPFAKQYIEVGHISVCGDYFSKRLLIAYQTPTGRDFPAVISGTVLSVPRLLGCLLEANPEKFVIPPKIVEHMPTDYVAI